MARRDISGGRIRDFVVLLCVLFDFYAARLDDSPPPPEEPWGGSSVERVCTALGTTFSEFGALRNW